jgi:DNA invertase Pin-like site-specific DNA recombinase
VTKSVAKWTWHNFDLDESDKRFSKLQSFRGHKGGVASGLSRATANEDKRASARLMRAQGMSLREIGHALGVSHVIVRKWCSGTSEVLTEAIIR